MHKARSQQLGFTIVELLVVIVVIGILAAVTIVSYTGINQKATVALLKSDLSISARTLKMYYTEHGTYPQSMNGSNCPQTPVVDSKYCLKPSSGNTLSYCPTDPYNIFALKSTSTNGTSYFLSDNSAPIPSGSASAIFVTGGSVSTSTCTRIHTFGTSCTVALPCTITASSGGMINLVVNGAGGGGGGPAEQDYTSESGLAGGQSSVTVGGKTYVAQGGGGGPQFNSYFGVCGGTAGNGGFVNHTLSGLEGGGAAGGNVECDGGAGGSVRGTLTVAGGDTVSIVVGSGGSGGLGIPYDFGLDGSNGSVTISYFN